MELIPLAVGVLCFLIGSIRLKRGKGYKAWLVFAILCFVVTIVLGGLRLLNGVTIPYQFS